MKNNLRAFSSCVALNIGILTSLAIIGISDIITRRLFADNIGLVTTNRGINLIASINLSVNRETLNRSVCFYFLEKPREEMQRMPRRRARVNFVKDIERFVE